ncbi:MAG: aldose epimerase family protein [Pseudomonadota bacterium]
MTEAVWLEDGDVKVHQLARGCITRCWQIGNRSAVLGYAHPADYADNPYYLGAIVGRVANRISAGRFTLDGATYQISTNEGDHTLHGGLRGLSTHIWQIDTDGTRAVRYLLRSEDGDQGFPGRLDLEVVVTLQGHTVTWDMTARPDRPTPVSLAQHSYYALGPDARQISLQMPAAAYTVAGPDNLPTGEIAPVNQEMDFRKGRVIAQPLDTNFVLDSGRWSLSARGEWFDLSMSSDQAGVQVYTAQHLQKGHTPLPGQNHRPHAGLALEPQGWPDAVNQRSFPNVIATPDAPYRQKLSVTITPRQPD